MFRHQVLGFRVVVLDFRYGVLGFRVCPSKEAQS